MRTAIAAAALLLAAPAALAAETHKYKPTAGVLTFAVRPPVLTIKPGDVVETEMEPYRGPDGSITTLQNSVFSTVPGSPAWIAKAGVNRVDLDQYGMSWEYSGRNAIQSEWRMEHAA